MDVKILNVAEKQHVTYCIPLWLRDEQVKQAIARVKGRIQPGKTLTDEPIAAVSFGPSLADTWEEIKAFNYIITCSGAHKFLVDRGIIPTWHAEVDPRPHKVQLIGQPQKETEYLIASTCHAAVFDHLEGYNVKLWHVFATEEEAFRILPPEEWAITGGASVGLRTLSLARFLGFTNIHVFGMDGCEGKTGKHAAEHPNQPKGHAITVYKGVEYKTTASLLECAKQTFHEIDQLPDTRVTFHGEGLVQAMAADHVPKTEDIQVFLALAKPSPISTEYVDLNKKLHERNLEYGVGGGKHAKVVQDLKKSVDAESVLDYGCQPPEAKILTPTGWRQMRDIQVGDQVIGANGQPIEVIGKHCPGRTAVYRVTFTDGARLVVDGGHLWAVRTSNHQKRGTEFSVKRTLDLIGDLSWPNAASLKWRIPMVKPVDFAVSKHSVVHPYLLGLLLGDGNLSQGCAKLFTIRDEVLEAAQAVMPAAVGFSRDKSHHGSYRIVKEDKSRGIANPVTDVLRDLGLWGLRAWEKFVPHSYLVAPVEDRIALLQGLMDTDGEVSEHHLSYSSTSRQLTDDVAFIVQSLGGTAKVVERALSVFTTMDGDKKHGRRSWVVHLKVPANILPTRVKSWEPNVEYHPNRIIESIEPAGESEVMGLEVAAQDQLYVTEHCIVTHNCGKGYLAKALPFPIWEYDPAIPGKEETPRPADLVVCTDVLEHIEPDRLVFVLDDLRRCTLKLGYFVIHTGPSSKTLADGRNTHLIQKDKTWWALKLSKYFEVAKLEEASPLIYALVVPLSKKHKKTYKII